MPRSTPSALQGCLIFLLATLTAGAQSTNQSFAASTARAFVLARQAFEAHPSDDAAAVQLGRLTYAWAELATNSEQRASVAQVGIAACRQLVERNPQSAPGHYYLGMNYGELAEAEQPSMAAYRLIRDIEHEFKTAAELDERVDYGGPARCLGLLYRDAPGWPISIGSRRKAREYMERALALGPEFPENTVNWLESNIQWHQAVESEAAWRRLAALWPAAQTNFTGVVWDSFWDDWKTRRSAAKAEFEKVFKQTLQP